MIQWQFYLDLPPMLAPATTHLSRPLRKGMGGDQKTRLAKRANQDHVKLIESQATEGKIRQRVERSFT